MNVTDVKNDRVYNPDTWIQECMEAQHKLASKYLDIEEANGLLETRDMPVNLDDKFGQARLKSMFWRVTEEIAEALEAEADNDEVHTKEELADAFHFLLEAALLGGIEEEFIKKGWKKYQETYSSICLSFEDVLPMFLMSMGLAANCLKNKPWKTTNIKTDKARFKVHLINAVDLFLLLCTGFDLCPKELFDYYFRKNKVNQFRQESNY